MPLPIIKAERLYQKISKLLIQQIKDGKFIAGQALPAERDLSQQLGVSRSSVREALIVLEILGWVDIRTGNGVFVKNLLPAQAEPNEFDEISVEELLKARELIEGELAALAAINASDAQLLALQQVMQQMQDNAKDSSEFHDLDMKFHFLIGELTGNTILEKILKDLWNQRYSAIFTRFEALCADDVSEVMLLDHQNITAALVNRDANAARQAMRTHLQHVYSKLFKPNFS
ncbi:FadR/GntR family transcriptional regulator [Deefgea sp. CFH1-16]|uniref:FadR/GntR family transcriptional regulator n=1 Tax=Deefgea sp. CFH1-16 TaxID=2675457 RepID=UPI0015F6CFB5|nr:FadR/GntR family transcriptional regulator [Deefgea sp. CFH1-16]MBM5575355.1 FCD domain-containing protein [Deefgea sp. CFH1-16]